MTMLGTRRSDALATDTALPPDPHLTACTTAVDLIIEETTVAGITCDRPKAWAIVHTMAQLPARAQTRRDRMVLFGPGEMDQLHEVLDVVMPDDTRARPGTAHAALQTVAGTQLTHTRRILDGGLAPDGTPAVCCVGYPGVLTG